MSTEELTLWVGYSNAVFRSALLSGKTPLSFEDWCASKVINPAPLIAWYEKHKAKKSKQSHVNQVH